MATVTMFASHSCRFCQQAMQWIREHPDYADRIQIRFIDEEKEAQQDCIRLGFRGVPAFVTQDDQWDGWNPSHLEQALQIPQS